MNKKIFFEPQYGNERKNVQFARAFETSVRMLLENIDKANEKNAVQVIRHYRTEHTLTDFFSPDELASQKVINAAQKGKELKVCEDLGVILNFTPAEFIENFGVLEGEGYLYRSDPSILGTSGSPNPLPYKELTYNFQCETPFVVLHNGCNLAIR